MTNVLKFFPVVFLIVLLLGFKIDMIIAVMLATIVAFILDMILTKKKLNDVMDAGMDNVKKVVPVLFILVFAYALGNSFMSTGVGAILINTSLDFGASASTVPLISFLVTCALSVATGTSWGTMAACAPILLWLNYVVGGSIPLTAGAILGGSCFGDNIGLISDTTILSSGVQGVKVTDRVRHQGVWSLLCVLASSILFFMAASNLSGEVIDPMIAISSIPQPVWDGLAETNPSAVDLLNQVMANTTPIYMLIPLFIVLGTAMAGLDTLICLVSGILSSYILGIFAGTVTDTISYLHDVILTGFSDSGSWVIVVSMFTSLFAGIMSDMDAFRPISKFIIKRSHKVRHILTWNALLCLLGNASLADETAMIMTVGPITRGITDEAVEANEEDMYKLRTRNAAYADAFGVFGAQLIPWHGQIVYYLALCSTIFPLHEFVYVDVISHSYMTFVTLISMLVLTITGLDNYIPLFKIPVEPDVRLKKNIPLIVESTSYSSIQENSGE